MTSRVDYRPARPADMLPCAQIWSISIEAYVSRLNQPWFAGDLEPLARLLGHFLRTDPSLFWVGTSAAEPARVVAFGSATLRGSTWFLGMLFVLPEFQGAGVGRALMDLLLPPVGQRGPGGLTLGTATDSIQPISNALYGSYGIVPRMPIFQFVGRPERTDHLPHLPDDVTGTEWGTDGDTGVSGEIGRIDLATLGATHPEDHAFLASERRRRFVYWKGASETVGYGYIAPSGRIGPIAALDAGLLAPIAVDLIERVTPPGAYTTWVPGAADELYVTLLRAGMRFEAFPALYLWDRPIADFSRYVPINLALL